MADILVEEWKFELDGHTFNAKHFSSDVVEVTSPTIDGKKTTQGGASGPKVIAKMLAKELIREGAPH